MQACMAVRSPFESGGGLVFSKHRRLSPSPVSRRGLTRAGDGGCTVLDLMSADWGSIQRIIEGESDPEVLRHLVALQEAALVDDLEGRVDAIEGLSNLLVLERGMGL